MSTLRVNNIEPTSGENIVLTGNITFITPAGKEIEFNDSDTNFSGSVTITGSLNTDKGDVLINKGNLIIKSGSIVIGSGSLNTGYTSGSTSSSYWEITSSVTISGSDGGTLDIIGDSNFQGDMIISGCLDIFCYTDETNPVFWAVDGRTTPDVSGLEVVSINYSTYGDLTAGIAVAAAASNNICYIYDPSVGTYAPYAYAGTDFDGVVTYISSSGPSIPTGTIVQIGFPFPIPGATPIYPIGTGSLTPVASFCCDGTTLYGDVTISGGLDVYGPTNLHDGLIVTGCIEMYCPGDVETAWYGYAGNTRFSKSSASVFLNYAHLNQSYGDVRTYISQSAAANQGTLQLYNTVTGTTQTVPYITSSWTGQLTLVEYVTPTLTNFSPLPGPIIHIGNQIPDLQPFGADTLMGSGSNTPVQTATFCCDGNVLYGDSTFTGSVTVTGSTTTTGSVTITGSTSTSGPVTITGPLSVTGSILYTGSFDGKGDSKISGSLIITGSLIVSGGNTLHNIGAMTTGLSCFVSTGSNAMAQGFFTTASGSYSHAEGRSTTSLGSYSHAEGRGTTSLGSYSHAEGDGTITIGTISHTEGYYTIASGSYSHAEGESTTSTGFASHAEGSGSVSFGIGSHAEGLATSSSGSYSHAEGNSTISSGSYSHAEGAASISRGDNSHAEGSTTVAIGFASHTEGYNTVTSGAYSHAEGNSTTAKGEYSHAEGSFTISLGNYSHAEGRETIASGSYQHVQGQYNTHGDTTSLMIVGNGTSGVARKDAFKVTMSGSIVLPTTQSIAPAWSGSDGEIIPATVGGQYRLYMWMNGAWRSSSFA